MCSCGNKTRVTTANLKSGQKKTCEQCASKKHKRTIPVKNEYIHIDDYYKVLLNNNQYFYIDDIDYKTVSKHKWYISSNGYVVSNIRINGIIRYITIHRYILGLIDVDRQFVVDHIDHNPKNNRRNNLRICSQSQNMMNTDLRPYNTSGVKGVFWNSERNKWMAIIWENNKKHFLGYFMQKEDAINARKEAEKMYFKEYNYKEER